MAEFASPYDREGVGARSSDVIDDYNDHGFNSMQWRLPKMCPTVNEKSGTHTVPAILTDLLPQQAKHTF